MHPRRHLCFWPRFRRPSLPFSHSLPRKSGIISEDSYRTLFVTGAFFGGSGNIQFRKALTRYATNGTFRNRPNLLRNIRRERNQNQTDAIITAQVKTFCALLPECNLPILNAPLKSIHITSGKINGPPNYFAWPRGEGAPLLVYRCIRYRDFVIIGPSRFVLFRQFPLSIRAQRGIF